MNDEQFLQKIREKIARLTEREVQVVIDESSEGSVSVEMGAPVPRVVLSPQVVEYPGLARMSIEYAVACIQRGHELNVLEFHMLLRRN